VNEQKIQDAIAVLEREVPKDHARVRMAQYGGGPDESQIIANRLGFLRLGVEFLKAAYAPISGAGDSTSVTVDLDYLLTEDSYQFDWFERREPSVERQRRPGRFVPVVILSSIVAGVVLAIIGLYVVARWIVA
jgi:hypothetical protein